MIDLILLTAGYRLDNLKKIAESIVDVTKDYKTQLNITWLICKDQYNSFGSMEGVASYCSDNQLNCIVLPTGKPNQSNYGGDSFNGPLFEVMSNPLGYGLVTSNPWIYILDDDNILHPFIPDYLIKLSELQDQDKYKAIWLTKQRSTGITDQAFYWTAGMKVEFPDGSWYSPGTLCPDPSQIILKWEVIKDRGGYGAGFAYDFEWCLPVMLELKESTMYFNGGISNLDEIDAYHNGLRTEKEFIEDLRLIDDCKLTTASLLIQFRTEDASNNDRVKARLYPIKPHLIKKILQLIKDDEY